VSTIRRLDGSMALVHALQHAGYEGRLAVSAHSEADAERLRAAGADEVLLPYDVAGAEAVAVVTGSRRRDDGASETSGA
jgi:hypothetical protein